MRKVTKIIIILCGVLAALMPVLVFGLPPIATMLGQQAGKIALSIATLTAGLFPDIYYSILPALAIAATALYYREKLQATEGKNFQLLDAVWLLIATLFAVVLIFAYIAEPSSPFRQTQYIFGFLDSLVNGLGSISPDLRTFSLWSSLIFMLTSVIFLYWAIERMGRDKQTSGALMIGLMMSFVFAVFETKVPIMAQLEEGYISALFSINRNPSTSIDPFTGMKYCPEPYDSSGKKIDKRPPAPQGIRDDIMIVGVSNETIEKSQGNWPLDWAHYANLADRFSGAKKSIVLFDISFLDNKGVFGGNYCGVKFKCTPLPGHTMSRQIDILAGSFRRAENTVISDFPVETTDEARSEIHNYDARRTLLKEIGQIRRIKNGQYGRIWAKLPLPPVTPILKNLGGTAYANILKNQWGLNRRMPIVMRIKNQERAKLPGYDPNKHDEFYPGVDLLIATKYYGVDMKKDVVVDWLAGTVTIENIPLRKIRKIDRAAMQMKEFDIMAKPNQSRTITIPIDNTGLMNINFRGSRYCFEFRELLGVNELSAEDVQGNFDGKIVLVAMYYATGVGTAKDMHLSPYGDMAGIEHHAYALNTILNQDFARDAPPLVNIAILIVIGLLMGLYQPRVSTAMSFVLLVIISMVFIAITNFVTFQIYSIIHIVPTALILQFVVAIAFIGFRALTEEENVKFIRDTFSKFVAEDVVDELLKNPDAITLGGAKKDLSVFFSDIRGFTTISESLGPEELVQLLNEYLSEMTELIIDYRGTVDKYMGDAIMAFWGAPVKNDDHAYYTCVAAIAQINALEKLRTQWAERKLPVIDIGIGVNSGAAVVGNMGSSHRMDYTLMGDTVNLGSRLEGITKQYGVRTCISEYTYEHVKDRVYARELDVVKVKGKNEPVRIYELIGLVDDSDLEKLKRTYKK